VNYPFKAATFLTVYALLADLFTRNYDWKLYLHNFFHCTHLMMV